MKRLAETILAILLVPLVLPLFALAFAVVLLAMLAFLVGLSLLDAFEGWSWKRRIRAGEKRAIAAERERLRRRFAWERLSKGEQRDAAARAVRP